MLEETLYHWSPAASGSSVDVDVDAHSSESGPKALRRLDLKVQSADDAGMGVPTLGFVIRQNAANSTPRGAFAFGASIQ